MKIAIVGSREYPRPQDVTDYVARLPADTVIVSGGARGVDSWAERAARARGLAVEIFPANWTAYGKRAGYVRNAEIVKASDRVVAFWDGESRGTAHTMECAKHYGKPLEVIRPA